jgi:phosphate transport system protein
VLKDKVAKLNKLFLEEVNLVSDMLKRVREGIHEQHVENLQKIISEDEVRINAMEIEIETACIRYLALFQPTAKDLREIIMIMKINTDLERIADLITDIAECGIFFKPTEVELNQISFDDMFQMISDMLGDVIKSYVEHDTALAQNVRKQDIQVNKIRDANFKRLVEHIKLNSEAVDADLNLMRISKKLERIADHISNIAEDVVYIERALIIKHKEM